MLMETKGAAERRRVLDVLRQILSAEYNTHKARAATEVLDLMKNAAHDAAGAALLGMHAAMDQGRAHELDFLLELADTTETFAEFKRRMRNRAQVLSHGGVLPVVAPERCDHQMHYESSHAGGLLLCRDCGRATLVSEMGEAPAPADGVTAEPPPQ